MDASDFTIRAATLDDATAISELVNRHAAQGLMLPKNLVQVYESLREFVVAIDGADGRLIGCGALRLMWRDLAEIRSLAVSEDAQGRGVGRALVGALVVEADRLGLARIFALTYQQLFFEKLGFECCDKSIFPQKVWADCRACPKQHCCDEIAMIRVLDPARVAQRDDPAAPEAAAGTASIVPTSSLSIMAA